MAHNLKKDERIFVISFQRTGTTSTGQFFRDHSFQVAGWSESNFNGWTETLLNGNYSAIFGSRDFLNSVVFEDSPWFIGGFYKMLYHQFPQSKFILLERDEQKWFDSMISHSNGKTLGNTYLHCIIYDRLDEFYKLPNHEPSIRSGVIDNLLPLNETHREHYTRIYRIQNREVKTFFRLNDPSRLFTGRLEDSRIWQKLGQFFGIHVKSNYSVHANRS